MSNLDSMGMYGNTFLLLMMGTFCGFCSSDILPTVELLFRKVIASLIPHLNHFVEAAIFFVLSLTESATIYMPAFLTPEILWAFRFGF